MTGIALKPPPTRCVINKGAEHFFLLDADLETEEGYMVLLKVIALAIFQAGAK
jgi:hypothetical protein